MTGHDAPAPGAGAAAPEEGPLFDQMGLHPDLLKGIREMGFIRPTPVQARAIPPILEGRDVIGCAQTGTGKTAAFVLPILHRLLNGSPRPHMRALIISPTRELALQSMEHLKLLSRFISIRGMAIFGGVPMQPQIRALETGLDIVSATPGRFLDHLYSGRIELADLEVFVLDEVDQMLDMGFLPDIHKILRVLPPRRQNLVFSATLPAEIQKLVHSILNDPVLIQVGRRSTPAVGIRQAVYPVAMHQKTDLLLELLRGQGMTSVIVFSRTKLAAEKLGHQLRRQGVPVSVIHGDRSQERRLIALEEFKIGRTQVLVATDVAARGIDIDDITHVINYDVPDTPEAYVHRIGRTARGEEATGDAFTLMAPEEEDKIVDIEKALTRQLPRVTLPDFHYRRHGAPAPARHGHASSGGRRHGQGHSRRPGQGHGHGHSSSHGHSHSSGHGHAPSHRPHRPAHGRH